MAGWGLAGYDRLRQGVRPILLLLPGQRLRARLAMLVFREAIRRGLPIMGLAGTAWFVGAWALPWQWVWTTALAMTILFGGGVLALASMLALLAWLRPGMWRSTTLAIAGLATTATGVLLAAWWIDQAPTSEPAFVLLGVLLAVGLVATALGLVRLSAPAWARLDVHRFARPGHDRVPFGPPV